MKAAVRLICALATVAAGTAIAYAAHTHSPTPATWTLDVKASDFGGGPTMKSDVMTITTDTDAWLKFSDVSVDGDGKTWKISWSGPQDGTFKPVTGMPGGKAAFKTADDSSVFVMPDGSEFACTLTMDSGKKKVTNNCTAKAGGKSFHQTLHYNRTK